MIDMPWIASAILFVIILACSLWTFLTHHVPGRSRGPFYKPIGIGINILVIGVFGLYGTVIQYKKQKVPKNAPLTKEEEHSIVSDVISNEVRPLIGPMVDIMGKIATNQSIDPATREQATALKQKYAGIESKYLAGSNSEQEFRQEYNDAVLNLQSDHARRIARAEPLKNSVLPYFHYAILSLSNASEQIAVEHNDKLVFTNTAIPIGLSYEKTNGGDFGMLAADIRFQTNASWHIEVNYSESLTQMGDLMDAHLLIHGQNCHFRLEGDGRGDVSEIVLCNGAMVFNTNGLGDTIYTNIDRAVKVYIGASLENVFPADAKPK